MSEYLNTPCYSLSIEKLLNLECLETTLHSRCYDHTEMNVVISIH